MHPAGLLGAEPWRGRLALELQGLGLARATVHLHPAPPGLHWVL